MSSLPEAAMPPRGFVVTKRRAAVALVLAALAGAVIEMGTFMVVEEDDTDTKVVYVEPGSGTAAKDEAATAAAVGGAVTAGRGTAAKDEAATAAAVGEAAKAKAATIQQSHVSGSLTPEP